MQTETSAARESLILEHMQLIDFIVGRIAVRLPSHIDRAELASEGALGLMDAIEKFKPGKDCSFRTYAELRIRGAILDYLRSLDWVPRSVRQKSRELDAAYADVERELGRSASEDEVGEALGLDAEEFQAFRNKARGPSLTSLDAKRGGTDGEDSGTFSDVVEDVRSENPFAALKNRQTRTAVLTAIEALPERERLAISLHYFEGLNLKEVGVRLGIGEGRVSQIHTKARARLQSALRGMAAA